MAKRAALSTSARRALVSNFVTQGLVHSQSDLVALLGDEGIEVTQATASRDLEEIGAVRGRDDQGIFRYRLLDPSGEIRARFSRVSDELVLSIVASGNLLVVKTPAGGAQLLASTLDRAAANNELPNIIGTIAGDDTVLVVSRSASGAPALERQLREFLQGAPSKRAGKSVRTNRTRKGGK